MDDHDIDMSKTFLTNSAVLEMKTFHLKYLERKHLSKIVSVLK